MANFIALALAVFKAIPILDRWFQELMAAYAEHQINEMKKEHRDAIRRAITDHDQRSLEKAIGSTKAGEASGVPGTEIRDRLPGVK